MKNITNIRLSVFFPLEVLKYVDESTAGLRYTQVPPTDLRFMYESTAALLYIQESLTVHV